MKLTINLDRLVARVQAKRARDTELRARGVAVLRDWAQRFTKPRKKGRLT